MEGDTRKAGQERIAGQAVSCTQYVVLFSCSTGMV